MPESSSKEKGSKEGESRSTVCVCERERVKNSRLEDLAVSRAIGLAEDEDLELVVTSEHTSASNGTGDVDTSTLEERLGTLLLDLGEGVSGAPVLDGLTRGHHHTTTHSFEGVRGQISTDGDTPAKEEGGQEGVGESASEEHGLERIVETEVETTVDNDAQARDVESTVEADDTVRLEGLPVDVEKTIELTLTSPLVRIRVVGMPRTGRV